jgi:hypothetical protein
MGYNFDINVLVNGNRCKFYHHQGKTFIEAKHGSEYELEIKNNTWGRVLSLTSVDGLNVLNGTPATDDDPGYVIPAYSPLRIKGFRYSNDEVAAFKFSSKDGSYAHAVGGCEAAKNCGVIGFKLYNEVVKFSLPNWNITWQNQPNWGNATGGLYGAGRYGYTTSDDPMDFDSGPQIGSSCCGGTSCSSGPTYNASIHNKGLSSKGSGQMKCSNSPLRSFDMGSTWGQKIESKVVETDFEKGCLTFNLDIYYASRQSLIDMGVPINVGHQVSFPQSFPNKYATPPSGWRG